MDSYAIVETGGMQFRMEPGKQIDIPKVEKKQGSKLRFDRVLLISDDKGIEVGTPVVKNVSVSAKVVEHGRGPKIAVYKRKRRKGYEKRTGHRQDFTRVLVESVDRKAPRPKKQAKQKAAEVEEPSKVEQTEAAGSEPEKEESEVG